MQNYICHTLCTFSERVIFDNENNGVWILRPIPLHNQDNENPIQPNPLKLTWNVVYNPHTVASSISLHRHHTIFPLQEERLHHNISPFSRRHVISTFSRRKQEETWAECWCQNFFSVMLPMKLRSVVSGNTVPGSAILSITNSTESRDFMDQEKRTMKFTTMGKLFLLTKPGPLSENTKRRRSFWDAFLQFIVLLSLLQTLNKIFPFFGTCD